MSILVLPESIITSTSEIQLRLSQPAQELILEAMDMQYPQQKMPQLSTAAEQT